LVQALVAPARMLYPVLVLDPDQGGCTRYPE
jgi:hypothetical protein